MELQSPTKRMRIGKENTPNIGLGYAVGKGKINPLMSPSAQKALREEFGGEVNKFDISEIDNMLSPKKESGSPRSSPRSRGALKQKRIKSLVGEGKDVAKLQEEVNENRVKIASLHTILSSALKEKDSIAQQLHILEELKQTLTQQLSEKDNQITSLDARAQEMGLKVASTEATLTARLKEAEKDGNVKVGRKEVVSQLKDRHHQSDIGRMKEKLVAIRKENADNMQKLQQLQHQKEQAQQQNAIVIESFAQNTALANQKYEALKQDFFISTCLAVKLNLSLADRPVNIDNNTLWELARERDVPIEQYSRFIVGEIRRQYDAVAVKKR